MHAAWLILSASLALAGDRGLMVIPITTGDSAAPKADPERQADAAIMKTYWDPQKISALYQQAVLDSARDPRKLSAQESAALLVKYGISLLAAQPRPAIDAAARQFFARAAKLDPELGFAHWGLAATSGCLGHFVPAQPRSQYVWGSAADCDKALAELDSAITANPLCGFFYYERAHYTAQKHYTLKGGYYDGGRVDLAPKTKDDCTAAAHAWLGGEWDLPHPSQYCDENVDSTIALKYFIALLYKHPPKGFEPDLEGTSVPDAAPGH